MSSKDPMHPIVKVKLGDNKISVVINGYSIESVILEDPQIFFNKMLEAVELNPKFFPIKTLELSGEGGVRLIKYLQSEKIINNNINVNGSGPLVVQLVYKSEVNILIININDKQYVKHCPWINGSVVIEWNKLVDVVDEPNKKISKSGKKLTLELNTVGYKAKSLLNYLKENNFIGE